MSFEECLRSERVCQAEELQVQCEEDFKLFIPQLQDASYKSRAWNGAESKVQDQRKGVVPRKVETSHTTNQRSRSKSQGGAEELKYLITVEDLLRVFSDVRTHATPTFPFVFVVNAAVAAAGKSERSFVRCAAATSFVA